MNAKRHTLANALRAASDVYRADAATMRQAVHTNPVADQFERQATECLALAAAIEQADTITLED